jgi:acyl-CoA synthetase (AMP-forming)/AMP-acid ligase II
LKDGWLHTGDMGRLDENGYLYLVDRKQFMIITGGYNVYPIEVENVIAAHPDVLETCVFGVPDDKWGEAVHAVIVVRSGRTLRAEDVNDWCKARLAQFKRPKSIEFRETLMRGATGKIQKRAEQARATQALSRAGAQAVSGA